MRTPEEKTRAFERIAAELDVEALGARAAFSLVLSEALNNVVEHSGSLNGGVIAASRFSSRITMAIVDNGVGVGNHLRMRHGPSLSDSSALLRAIEPGVTGAAAPGYQSKGRATPTNAGLGLFVIREVSRSPEGRMMLLSGDSAILMESCSGLKEGEPVVERLSVPWRGTVLCVSFSVNNDESVRAVDRAIRRGMKEPRSAKEEIFSFQPLSEERRTYLSPTYHGMIEDKAVAHRVREEVLLPAIRSGKAIELNLESGQLIAHSFAHALLYQAVLEAGYESKKLIHVRAKTKQIKDTLRMVARMAREDFEDH